ncbi:MAG: XdhC/CoxI family protein [Chloroflexia bacterium]
MPVYSQLAGLLRENRPAALATVVSGERIGSKILVAADGGVEGSIHPLLNEQIASDALSLLASGRNELKAYEAEGERFDVFIESFPPPQRLVIIGGVHIAIPLHRLAKLLGYHVTVVDARGSLATPERFPQADSIMVEWPDDALASLGLDSGTSVVVLTHDPKFDYPALLAAIQSPARYIGAIGSRTTNEQRTAALRDMGATGEQLARIHAPVGLDIGAKTPAEIALAVMSEIVANRYGRHGGHLSGR